MTNRSAPLFGIFLLFSLPAFAADEGPSDDNQLPKITPADDVSEDVGSMAPLAFFIGKQVTDKQGTEVGEIDDVIVDPYTGWATTIVVHPSSKVQRDSWLLLPINLVTPVRLEKIRARTYVERIEEGPTISRGSTTPYLRQVATVPFEFYDLDPVWVPRSDEPESNLKYDDRLLYATSLPGMPVKNNSGQNLGFIGDFMISTDNGRIAYVIVLESLPKDAEQGGSSEPRRWAVPVAAFASKEPHREWNLDLSPEEFANMPALDAEAMPRVVSSKWKDFIKSHHGTEVLGGIQRADSGRPKSSHGSSSN